MTVVGNATPTPVSDGHNVYVLFSNGVVASFTADGAPRWTQWMGERPMGMNGYESGQAASPVLAGKNLVVAAGRLRGLDADDGHTLSDAAPYLDFGTPALAHPSDGDVLITPQGTVRRISDGTVVARKLDAVFYQGPVVQERRAYFVGSEGDINLVKIGNATASAFELPETIAGEVRPLWNQKLTVERYYASPLQRDGRLYAASEAGQLAVLDAATGILLAQRSLDLAPGPVYASLTLAGRDLFVSNEQGSSIVLGLPGLTEVARNQPEPFRSTPLFHGRRMYIRGQGRHWCIEERPPNRRK